MSVEAARDGDKPWIGPEGQRTDRLELHLSYRCPNRCRFCSEAERMGAFRGYPVSWGRVATVLRRHAERGVRVLHLTGGEPTVHPRFLDALQMAHKLGMRTSVSTNGAMLSREEFAQRAIALLDDGMFSLHGPTAEVHERMTMRPGSFDQVVTAIRLAQQLKPVFEVHVNIVVTKLNVEALGETVSLAGELGASLIVVSNVSPEGRGRDNYAELAVRLEELARVLPTLPARAPAAIVRFFALPLCLLGEHAMLSNDLYWDPRVTVEWQSQPGKVVYGDVYSWRPQRKRVHVTECTGCLQRNVCMGVFEEYHERYPVDVLRPVTREVK